MSVVMGLVVVVVSVWDVMLDAHKMSSVVNTWMSEGPHTSLMGKVREHLAAAWWLGPLKVSSAREPLVECGVSVGGGWRDVLPLMVGLKARLACLESHIQLAQEEHETFITKFVVTVCCLVLVSVLGTLLACCCWLRKVLVKEADCHLETRTCLKPVRCESCPLERCVIVMIYEVVTRDGLMTRKGRYVHFDDNILNDGHVTGTLALPAPGVTVDNDSVVTVEDLLPLDDSVITVEHLLPLDDSVVPVEDTVAPVEDTVVPVEDTVIPVDYVRRSLLVPRRFRDRLTEANGCLLKSMQDQYSVTLFKDAARARLHIKGTQDNVLQCYAQLKALIADWRARETSEV